jgi:hypothetical protein
MLCLSIIEFHEKYHVHMEDSSTTVWETMPAENGWYWTAEFEALCSKHHISADFNYISPQPTLHDLSCMTGYKTIDFHSHVLLLIIFESLLMYSYQNVISDDLSKPWSRICLKYILSYCLHMANETWILIHWYTAISSGRSVRGSFNNAALMAAGKMVITDEKVKDLEGSSCRLFQGKVK